MKECTKKEWEEILLPSEYKALEEHIIYIPDNCHLTSSEVFDMIVDYQGGIASGFQIRGIINRVYGVDLGPH